MSSLFDPQRHEPLAEVSWDEARARAAVDEILVDVSRSYHPERLWPLHPLDDDFEGSVPQKTVYVGAAGVALALFELESLGFDPRLDPCQITTDLHRRWSEAPDCGAVPSLFLGEVGVLLVQLLTIPDDTDVDRLYEAVASNTEHPSQEALWGSPGTMLGALLAHQITSDDRWADLFVDNVAWLWDRWRTMSELDEEHLWTGEDFHLWRQDLYGRRPLLFGAGHGAVGNHFALLAGRHLLSDDQQDELIERVHDFLFAAADRDSTQANWRPTPATDRVMVQWCHGAPGVITSMAHLPTDSPETEKLLCAGGELTWVAGPLSKGYGLCHGTAGNGYAFLELLRRTGDELWLKRARQFAMHAIGQRKRERQNHEVGRHNLWTGDLGLARFLAHCIAGSGELPLFAPRT